MEEKKYLIKKITEFHPTCGVERGWSEYTGGMEDTGRWLIFKMLESPLPELKRFYLELSAAKKNNTEISEGGSELVSVKLSDGAVYVVSEKQRDEYKKFVSEIEYKLFFGKQHSN